MQLQTSDGIGPLYELSNWICSNIANMKQQYVKQQRENAI